MPGSRAGSARSYEVPHAERLPELLSLHVHVRLWRLRSVFPGAARVHGGLRLWDELHLRSVARWTLHLQRARHHLRAALHGYIVPFGRALQRPDWPLRAHPVRRRLRVPDGSGVFA